MSYNNYAGGNQQYGGPPRPGMTPRQSMPPQSQGPPRPGMPQQMTGSQGPRPMTGVPQSMTGPPRPGMQSNVQGPPRMGMAPRLQGPPMGMSAPSGPPMMGRGMPPGSQPHQMAGSMQRTPPGSMQGQPPGTGMPPRSMQGQLPGTGYPPQNMQGQPPGTGMPPRSMQGQPPGTGYPPQNMPATGYPQNPAGPYGSNAVYPPGPGAPAGYPPAVGGGGAIRSNNPDTRQRIDPNQIPRPPQPSEVIRYQARGHTLGVPPPATSDYIVHDDGCCNPRFMRPTLNHIPSTKEIAKQCGIPISIIVEPLAELHPDEEDVPIVDFGPEGPLRCTRCKAYINCFSRFVATGRKYICSICGMSNDTPRDYYCNVDEHGRRRDVLQRPELCKGSVEFIVPEAYTIRPPQELIYVFAFDVSSFAVQSGLLSSAMKAMEACLDEMSEPERTKIGIVTFERQVQFFGLKNDVIKVYNCPDVLEPFAPFPAKDWLLPLHAIRDQIPAVRELIWKLYAETQIGESAAGSALVSISDTLAVTGGRILLFQSSVPRVGVGKVLREENQRHYGTEHEKPMYVADEKDRFYKNLSEECSKRQIVVDVFICGTAYADVATVGQVCKTTGGSLYYTPLFGKNQVEDEKQLVRQVIRLVQTTIGLEAVLKIRVSTGLRVEKQYGHMRVQSYGMETEMASVELNKAIVAIFEHEDDLNESEDVHIQAALLYTTLDGRRCVRVHNLTLQVAPLLSNVFRNADLDAACAVYLRQGTELMLEKSNSIEARDAMIESCVNVLYNYRKYCATQSSSGQLILPESLKLLPLYTLATLKSVAVRSNLTGTRGVVDVRADERAFMLNLFDAVPVKHAVFAVYPRLYALHDMPEDCGIVNESGQFVMPPSLPPTAERLSESGIFLLVNTVSMLLYIAPNANPGQVRELFGSEVVDSAEGALNFVESGSELKDRIEVILDEIRDASPVVQPLEIITKSDWRYSRFMNTLVEDRTKNDMSYVEFLCQLHKKIQSRFQ